MSETGFAPPTATLRAPSEETFAADVGTGWDETQFPVYAQGGRALADQFIRSRATSLVEEDLLRVTLGRTFLAFVNPQLAKVGSFVEALSVWQDAQNRLDRIEARQKHIEELLAQLVEETRRSTQAERRIRSVPLKALRDLMPELNEPVTQEEREALEQVNSEVVAAFMRGDEHQA